jgi:hypothetical protein
MSDRNATLESLDLNVLFESQAAAELARIEAARQRGDFRETGPAVISTDRDAQSGLSPPNEAK